MGISTGLLDPHLQSGGKHDGFFRSERAWGVAESLPLSVEAIKAFMSKKLNHQGPKRRSLMNWTSLDAFIDEIGSIPQSSDGFGAAAPRGNPGDA